ncbi:HlyD family efflux transporter periplasmic adaptor subunit [Bacillota bacterium]
MKKGKGKKWIAVIALLLAVIASAIGINYTGGVQAEVAAADEGPVKRLIKETGSVESGNTIVIASNFSGEIKGLVVSEGDSVKAGDILITGDDSVARLDLKSLRAELSALEISYGRAGEAVKKNKALYDQGALSREEYNGAAAAEKQLAAQVSSLRYSIESFTKASGALGVTAPFDGTITEVYAKEGEFATIGTSLFELADLEDLYIEVNLIAEDADKVEEGDQVLVYKDDSGGLPAAGSSVRRIHLKAREELSGLGIMQKRVKVEIQTDPGFNLRLGSDVDVEIVIDEKEKVLRVPENAVFQQDGNHYVFVAEGGKAHLRQLETGLEGDDYIEIFSGLTTGEKVIRSPGNEIEDGVRLK